MLWWEIFHQNSQDLGCLTLFLSMDYKFLQEPNPGFSNINKSGILIDLQKMNQITLSDDRATASLGPGGRWGEVIEALDPYGVSVIGGRIPNVGVAGVILGGLFIVMVKCNLNRNKSEGLAKSQRCRVDD